MEANYTEYASVPEYVAVVFGNTSDENGKFTGKPRWSGKSAPPAVGAKVNTHLGVGHVTSYFSEFGWLGVLVKFNDPPAWYTKQNNGNPPGHIFGAELR